MKLTRYSLAVAIALTTMFAATDAMAGRNRYAKRHNLAKQTYVHNYVNTHRYTYPTRKTNTVVYIQKSRPQTVVYQTFDADAARKKARYQYANDMDALKLERKISIRRAKFRISNKRKLRRVLANIDDDFRAEKSQHKQTLKNRLARIDRKAKKCSRVVKIQKTARHQIKVKATPRWSFSFIW